METDFTSSYTRSLPAATFALAAERSLAEKRETIATLELTLGLRLLWAEQKLAMPAHDNSIEVLEGLYLPPIEAKPAANP